MKKPTLKLYTLPSRSNPTARAKTCQRVCLCQRYKQNGKESTGIQQHINLIAAQSHRTNQATNFILNVMGPFKKTRGIRNGRTIKPFCKTSSSANPPTTKA
jgi:hypothetical protein